MENKIAGTLSLLGAVALTSMWAVFLFAARPECADSIELAISAAKYALSPSEAETWLFVYTLGSIFLCLTSSAMLFANRGSQKAMYIVAGHSIAALFVYTWSLILAIALPLIYFGKVRKNA